MQNSHIAALLRTQADMMHIKGSKVITDLKLCFSAHSGWITHTVYINSWLINADLLPAATVLLFQMFYKNMFLLFVHVFTLKAVLCIQG